MSLSITLGRMLRDHQGTLIRWIFGVGFLGLSFRCATTGYNRPDFVLLLIGVLFLVIGIVFLWKTIFHVATRPLMLLVDSIFFPGGELPKPVLNLKLPAYYLNEGRFDEALIEYRKILKYYPDEVEAYEKTIWLYLTVFKEPREAEKLLRRAKRRHLALHQGISLLVEEYRDTEST